mmetsp:Transcript_77665/g.174136  ORF Transcript_77665/g.174136 Transcript_77665/m.174136 type:complete len:201 (+) Transcript_77665:199-801(+)
MPRPKLPPPLAGLRMPPPLRPVAPGGSSAEIQETLDPALSSDDSPSSPPPPALLPCGAPPSNADGSNGAPRSSAATAPPPQARKRRSDTRVLFLVFKCLSAMRLRCRGEIKNSRSLSSTQDAASAKLSAPRLKIKSSSNCKGERRSARWWSSRPTIAQRNSSRSTPPPPASGARPPEYCDRIRRKNSGARFPSARRLGMA